MCHRSVTEVKVALTVWDDEISPVFDFAKRLLIVELKDGSILKRYQIQIPSERIVSRIAMLSHMNIEVVVCGAISEPVANMINARDICLVPFVTGKTEMVLNAFLRGLLICPEFQMPGHGKKGYRRRGQDPLRSHRH